MNCKDLGEAKRGKHYTHTHDNAMIGNYTNHTFDKMDRILNRNGVK